MKKETEIPLIRRALVALALLWFRWVAPLAGALCVLCLAAGCANVRALFHPVPVDRTTITTPTATVTQTGPAAAPAAVTTADTKTEIPVIPGATITITTPPPVVKAAGDTSPPAPPLPPVVVTTHAEHVAGPTSFAPPAPPTPAQVAAGDGVRIFYWLAAGCGLGVLLCIYTGHFKAAGVCAIGAAGIPLLIHLGQSVFASHLAVAVLCIAAALVVAWYLMRQHPEVAADVEARAALLGHQLAAKAHAEADKLRYEIAQLRSSAPPKSGG